MSIDIVIRQKGLFKKTLPLSVILGDHLVGGTYDQYFRLAEGHVPSGGEMAVYDPAHKARGFTVSWSRRSATLRALNPTTVHELRDYYAAVERIMTYWNATLEVDGFKNVPLQTFLGGLDSITEHNRRYLEVFSDKILAGEKGTLTMCCALWPLHFGIKEAQAAKEHPAGAADYLAHWLHDMQSIDAYYAAPSFYTEEGGLFGRFTLAAGRQNVFPLTPSVPFGAHDPQTGRPPVVEDYEITLTVPAEDRIIAEDRVIGTVPYDVFLNALEPDKVAYYDAGSILVASHAPAELEALYLRAERNLV
jgi:hypothetical protein